MIYKYKNCYICLKSFYPNSGSQKSCDLCRYSCIICSNKKSYNAKYCKNCYGKYREYKKTCPQCNKEFIGKNQFRKLCLNCCPDIVYCIDCNKQLSSKKRIRCNPCSGRNRFKVHGNSGKNWQRFRYRGNLYRSKWEIQMVKILNILGIKYEYEKYYPLTNSRPDFYLPDYNFWIEIHPDCYKQKTNLPPNTFLLKTYYEIYVMGLILTNLLYGKNYNLFKVLNKKQLNCLYKNAVNINKTNQNLAKYLKQAIMERNDNNIKK